MVADLTLISVKHFAFEPSSKVSPGRNSRESKRWFGLPAKCNPQSDARLLPALQLQERRDSRLSLDGSNIINNCLTAVLSLDGGNSRLSLDGGNSRLSLDGSIDHSKTDDDASTVTYAQT